MNANTRIRAARSLAAKNYPYLSACLWRLRIIECATCPTMGVDYYARLYYNKEWIKTKTAYELSIVLVHEVWHILRDHHMRARQEAVISDAEFVVWNHATDAEINDSLPKIKGILTPETMGLEPGKLAEQYYAELLKRLGGRRSGEKGSQTGGSGSGDGLPHVQCGSEIAGDTGRTGGGSGQRPPSPSGACSDPGQSGLGSSQGDTPLSGLPPTLTGGSCADGRARAWEEPGKKEDEISEGERKLIQRSVAEGIKSIGTQANNALREWADATLAERPIPWQQILSGAVRRAVAYASGQGDFSWQRPSRRSAGRPYLTPAIRRPVPEVAVVIDTSGSMSKSDLDEARRETEEILQATGASIRIISCDVESHDHGKKNNVRHLQLEGGGGTDMGNGLEMAQRLNPRPSIIVTITDGGTPWPKKAPAAKHITVLVGEFCSEEGAPWGQTVRTHQ